VIDERLFLVNLWPQRAGAAVTVRPVGGDEAVWLPSLGALAEYFQRAAAASEGAPPQTADDGSLEAHAGERRSDDVPKGQSG